MGASPHTPYYDNGMVWRESACGGQRLWEDVFCDKMASGFACEKRKAGEHVFLEKIIISPRAVGTTRESMRPLAKWLTAARAGLTDFSIPSFGYSTAYGGSACGGQRLCEHALSGKWISSFACRTDRFYCSVNRVLPSAGVDIGGQLLYNINVFLSVLSETGFERDGPAPIRKPKKAA